MKNIKKISGSSCGQFSNALHAGFHQRMYGYFTSTVPGTEKINVSYELLEEYLYNINLENDLTHETHTSMDATLLIQYDRERDELIDELFTAINSAAHSPLATNKAAYEILSLIIEPYSELKNEAMDTETAHISGLIADFKNPRNAEQITILGLTSTVSTLDTMNKRNEAIRNNSTRIRTTNKTENIGTVRQHTDACYQQICDYVYASLLLSKTAKDCTAIEELIDVINQTIAEFNTAYNMNKG